MYVVSEKGWTIVLAEMALPICKLRVGNKHPIRLRAVVPHPSRMFPSQVQQDAGGRGTIPRMVPASQPAALRSHRPGFEVGVNVFNPRRRVWHR